MMGVPGNGKRAAILWRGLPGLQEVRVPVYKKDHKKVFSWTGKSAEQGAAEARKKTKTWIANHQQ